MPDTNYLAGQGIMHLMVVISTEKSRLVIETQRLVIKTRNLATQEARVAQEDRRLRMEETKILATVEGDTFKHMGMSCGT